MPGNSIKPPPERAGGDAQHSLHNVTCVAGFPLSTIKLRGVNGMGSMAREYAREYKRKQKVRQRAGLKSLRHLLAGIAGTSVLFCPPLIAGAASNIESVGPTATTVSSQAIAGGTRYDVESQKVVNGNAFNGFKNFDLGAGDVANIFVPVAATTGNVLNFVKNQIQIAGQVNAIKDNKIGGNLYFLSSEGMIVSPGGQINAGSFYALTPTQSFMDNFLKDNTVVAEGFDKEVGFIVDRKIQNQGGQVKGEGVPLNSDATLTVQGRVSAIDNIRLHTGQTLTVNKGAGAGAKLETGVLDFSALVNTSALPGSVAVSGLSMTAGDNGNIILTAKNDSQSDPASSWQDWIDTL
ncbi:MAG: leukotoxin LktA family filamentous adhesin, partial [Acidaminococcales bacterium]|nr:leukotoxin LktA family filamentous adhesin [Acidaminococcales bacterium]